MPQMKSENLIKTSKKKARQAAIDYGIDVNQMDFILSLTPAERLRRHDAALVLVKAARKAGMRYYGFDNRPPETA